MQERNWFLSTFDREVAVDGEMRYTIDTIRTLTFGCLLDTICKLVAGEEAFDVSLVHCNTRSYGSLGEH